MGIVTENRRANHQRYIVTFKSLAERLDRER